MATTQKKKTVSKPAQVEIEINIDQFTNEDYEVLYDWATGNSGGYTVKQVFDLLDRVIVGGFRSRRFVDTKGIIEQMLTQITEASASKN